MISTGADGLGSGNFSAAFRSSCHVRKRNAELRPTASGSRALGVSLMPACPVPRQTQSKNGASGPSMNEVSISLVVSAAS